MPWPTLPPMSPANFLDHFPGSTLDPRWGSVVSGTGAVSVTDSYADLNAPANSAAFIYLKAQLDKTKSQLWTVCLSRVSGIAGGTPSFTVVNGASAPAADTQTNIDAKALIQRAIADQSVRSVFEWYWSSAAAQTFWGGSNGGNVWTPTYSSSLWSARAQLDDYYVLGLEIDGVNQRWRTLVWGQAFATAGTWTFDQGWRLFSLSDWVNWSATRSSANLWLCLGQMYNNDANAKDVRVEWVRYAEALPGNRVIDAWAASKTGPSFDHRIRHDYSYDFLTFVPDGRATWALDLGAGAPDNLELQEPCVVYDGVATDWLFYTGTASAGPTKSICVASAPHVGAGTGQNATFTRFASNPILALGASGQNDDFQMGFCDVVCDLTEGDPNKRWKMLYAGQKASDNKHRMMYATAPSPTGTWTKQGVVLDVGGSGAADEGDVFGMSIVRYNGQWEVWYEGHDSARVCHLLRATGGDLGNLTKDGVTYYTSPTSATDQLLTANLNTAPGRSVTVGSTTGFQVDATVVLSQSAQQDTYSTSKIRKIVSSTVIELYHGLTGFLTSSSPAARIKQTDSGPNFSPRPVVQIGSEWLFVLNLWEPFTNSPETGTYSVLLEEPHLFKHGAQAPNGATPVIQYQPSPITSRGFNNDQESFENMTILDTPFAGDGPSYRPLPVLKGP